MVVICCTLRLLSTDIICGKKADESRFLVDRNRKFNDITKLCSFLHISNNEFITRANNGDELNLSKLKINGHIVEINKKSGRSGFGS